MITMEKDENLIVNYSQRFINCASLFRKRALQEFYESIGEIESNSVLGESHIVKLLNMSRRSKIIKQFLVEILPFLKVECITETVLNRCINYRDISFRKTLCIQLAHMWLPIEQLKKLNTVLDTPEAYVKIVYILCKKQCSVLELESFLTQNEKYSYALHYLQEMLHNENIPNNLFAVIEKHCKQSK